MTYFAEYCNKAWYDICHVQLTYKLLFEYVRWRPIPFISESGLSSFILKVVVSP